PASPSSSTLSLHDALPIYLGTAISVPVGDATLGRIMNVIGEPIDEAGPIAAEGLREIHQDAPEFAEQNPASEVLVTGIKVVDLRSEEHTSELQSRENLVCR